MEILGVRVGVGVEGQCTNSTILTKSILYLPFIIERVVDKFWVEWDVRECVAILHSAHELGSAKRTFAIRKYTV